MPLIRMDQLIVPARPNAPTAADAEAAILYQATCAALSGLIPAGTANVYVPGPRTAFGFKYEWNGDGADWVVWGHSEDAGAQAGEQAAEDWTCRVKRGNRFLSPIGFGTGQGGLGPASRWWGGQHAERTHILLVR